MFRAPEVPVKIGFPQYGTTPQTNLGYMTLSADSSGGGRRQGGALFSNIKTRINQNLNYAEFEYLLVVGQLRLREYVLTHTSQLLHLFFIDIQSNLQTGF